MNRRGFFGTLLSPLLLTFSAIKAELFSHVPSDGGFVYPKIQDVYPDLLAPLSSLNRVSVRRMIMYITQDLEEIYANYTLFEPNDHITRAAFKFRAEEMLKHFYAKGHITTYDVVCNNTNNTPESIDRNEFHARISFTPRGLTGEVKLELSQDTCLKSLVADAASDYFKNRASL